MSGETESYVWSTEEELFSSEEYVDREGAAEAGHDETGESVYVGRKVPITSLELVQKVDVCGRISEQAWEMVGEAAESWTEFAPAQQRELDRLIADWIDRVRPVRFFRVDDAQLHPYPEPEQEQSP